MKKANVQKSSLPFFGIGKVIPFMKKYRSKILLMVSCGLVGSAMDIVIPLFQRYALNHYIDRKSVV